MYYQVLSSVCLHFLLIFKNFGFCRRSSENVGVGVSDQEKIRKVSGSDRLTKSHVVHSSSSSRFVTLITFISIHYKSRFYSDPSGIRFQLEYFFPHHLFLFWSWKIAICLFTARDLQIFLNNIDIDDNIFGIKCAPIFNIQNSNLHFGFGLHCCNYVIRFKKPNFTGFPKKYQE